MNRLVHFFLGVSTLSSIYAQEIIQDAKPESCQCFSTYDKIQDKEILPSGQVNIDSCVSPFISADYLMWYVNQEGLEYAFTGSSLNDVATSNNQLSLGHQFDPPGRLNSGFRVGFGLNTDYDNWEIGAYYTWIKTQSSSQLPYVTSRIYQVPYAFSNNLLRSSSNGGDQSVNGGGRDYKLYFNAFDLLLSKRVFITPKILIQPVVGLKGGYQKSRTSSGFIFSNGYFNKNNGTSSTNVSGLYLTKDVMHYGSIGPKIGLSTIWKIARSVGFVADLGFSNVWAWYKTKRTDVIPEILSSTNTTLLTNFTVGDVIRTKKSLNQIFETKLGFEFETCFHKGAYKIKTGAFWEGQIWMNQLQSASLQLPNANLILQGLTLDLRLDF